MEDLLDKVEISVKWYKDWFDDFEEGANTDWIEFRTLFKKYEDELPESIRDEIKTVLRFNDVESGVKAIANIFWGLNDEVENAVLPKVQYIRSADSSKAKKNMLSAIRKVRADYHEQKYTINIKIIENDRPKVFIGHMEELRVLHSNGNYEEAIRKARDIFQSSIEKDFNSSIKHFTNKSDVISVNINNILHSITNIRNLVKTDKMADFSNAEKEKICKLIIDQLSTIINFVSK